MNVLRSIIFLAFVGALVISSTLGYRSAQANTPPNTTEYSTSEILSAGHGFFGTLSGGLATMVERSVSRYGLPNGYIIGQEASGAIIGGLRYGEGTLFTKSHGQKKVFWQGPSFGFDLGADGDRTMMLVYDLPSPDMLRSRFGGVNGSAYFIGGLGMTVLANSETGRTIYVVPIRTGVGARLGINLGYLKFTDQPTWNPF